MKPKSKDVEESPAGHTRQREQKLTRRTLHSPTTLPKSPRTTRHALEGNKQGRDGKTSPKPSRLYPKLDSEQSESESDTDRPIGESGGKDLQTNKSRNKQKENARNKQKEKALDSPSSKKKQDLVDSELPPETKCNHFFLVVGLLCVLIGVVYICFDGSQESTVPNVDVTMSSAQMFVHTFKGIRLKFPSQTDRLWQVIGSAVKRVLSEDPSTYPAVILLGVPDGGTQTASCIARHVMHSVNSLFGKNAEVSVNCSRLTQISPAKTKLDLDQRLLAILTSSRGVVLEDFNSLPAQAALLMHGYCDGDNAPYKHVVFLQVLNTNLPLSELSEEAVENYLNQLWEADLGHDEMPALRSRIANNIIIVSPEKDLVCDI